MGINIGSIEADLKIDSGHLERGLANGRAAMAAFEKELGTLLQELQSGNILFADYATRIAAVGAAQAQMAAQMQTAYSAVGMGNGGLLQASNATSQMANGFARAGMQFGYMVDDIQYGVSSIINNVAPLAQSIATGMGASGAAANAWGASIQIAAVAAYQLYRNWDEFLSILEIPTVRTEAEEMEHLAEKTRKTADEQLRLNKYKREQKEIDDLLERKPKAEEKANKDAKDVIAEAGSEKVFRAIMQTLGGEGRLRTLSKEDKEAEEKFKKTENDFGENHPVTVMARKEMEREHRTTQAQVDKENQDLGRKILGDPDKRDTLIALAERNAGAFPKDFAGKLRDTSPDARKRQEEVKDEDKLGDQMSEEAAKKQAKNGHVKADEERAEQEMFDMKLQDMRDTRLKREAKRKEVVKNARKDSPGIDSYAQTLAAGTMVGDVDPKDALDQMKLVLKSNDQEYKTKMEAAKKTKTTDDDKDVEKRADNRADYAGKKILEEAGDDIKKKAIEEYSNPRQEKISRSEQFNAADLASKVQAGVNDADEGKKTNDYLDKAVKYLSQMAAKNGENPWTGFEEK